jgi:hypothetical protein
LRTLRRRRLAAHVYEISVDPNGLAKYAELNLDGLRRVLELRDRWSGFETKPLRRRLSVGGTVPNGERSSSGSETHS